MTRLYKVMDVVLNGNTKAFMAEDQKQLAVASKEELVSTQVREIYIK